MDTQHSQAAGFPAIIGHGNLERKADAPGTFGATSALT
jgi:hypothetical protein